ncbi:hypothetical protein [Paenibacillus sonchi]|uniref:hypothetical protein n=1 Tax=Paenibacillus sonchi TaxID=373687 RepID=UPI000584C61D|nr:hypothetical protein [Paenibacillus sonchi]
MRLKRRVILMLTATMLFLCCGSVSASSEYESYGYTKEELSFRQQFGLNADINKVDSKEHNVMVESKFGVRLTKLEEELLIQRINHQAQKLPLS